MDTDSGCAICNRSKNVVEPRIGHSKLNLGRRLFMRRGLAKVATEWMMTRAALKLRESCYAVGRKCGLVVFVVEVFIVV